MTDIENNGGIAPTTDLNVNSLTATSYVDTPELRSGAGDLQVQNALVTIRKEDGALLASFADGGILSFPSTSPDHQQLLLSTLDDAALVGVLHLGVPCGQPRFVMLGSLWASQDFVELIVIVCDRPTSSTSSLESPSQRPAPSMPPRRISPSSSWAAPPPREPSTPATT